MSNEEMCESMDRKLAEVARDKLVCQSMSSDGHVCGCRLVDTPREGITCARGHVQS